MGRLSKKHISCREKLKAFAAAKRQRRLQQERKETRELVGEGEENSIKMEPEEEGAEVKVEDGCYSLLGLKGTEDKDGVSESCFVCVQPLTSSSEGTRPKVTETEYICLLTDMLGLSRSQSNNYLKLIPEPDKWIGLCHECLELVKQVGERKDLINKIRREIKHNQQHILKKMKSTKLNLRIRGKGEEGNKNASTEVRALQAVRNILTFVHRRQYSTLLSDDDVPNSNKDNNTEPASSISKISDVGHPVIVSKQLRLQRPVPKKKTVKLAMRPLKTGGVNQQEEKIDKSDQWRDDHEEEDPIFLNADDHRMEEEAFAVTDPLALDDDADCTVNKPCSASQSQVYYCGLCADDQVYTSEEQLQLHTNQLHRPGRFPSKKVRRNKRRQRKQNFSADLEEEEEEFEEIPVRKLPRRSMETASNLLFTTSKRHPHPPTPDEADEKVLQVQPVKKREANRRPTETASSVLLATTSKSRTKPEDGIKPIGSDVDDDYKSEESLESDPEDEEANQEKGESAEAKPVRFQYDCPHCPDVKDYGLTRFAQHLAIHQRRPYRCSICSALFPSDEVQMEEHWKKKHSNVDVTTPQEKFTKMSLDPGEIWRCQGCPSNNSRFSKEEDRDAHELECSALLQKKKATQSVSKMVLSPDLIHSCQVCDKPFQSFDEWRLHRVLHHPDVDHLSCLLCELSFAEKTIEGVEVRDDLKMLTHIKQYHYTKGHTPVMHQHRVLYECEECGLVFNMGVESSAHFLSVHGISKGMVPCPVVSCGRRFVEFENVRRHVKCVHFVVDPAVCDVCGAGFKYLEGVVEHKLRKHGILEEDYSPVYSCPVEGCGYRTVKQRSLPIHSQMAHGVARRCICKICGKGFASMGKLKVHEQIHENKEKKPYQCEVCGNSFAVRNYLYIHKRLSHQNRKFPSTNKKRGPKPRKPRSAGNRKTSTEESTVAEEEQPVRQQNVEGVGEQL